MALSDLGIGQEIETAENGSRRDIVGQQPSKNFFSGPLLKLGRYDFPALHRIDCSVTRRLETRIVDQVLSVQRATHPRPFVVRQRAGGNIAVLRREYQIRT